MVGAGVHLGQSAELREAVSLKELHYLFRGERRDLNPSPLPTVQPSVIAAPSLSMSLHELAFELEADLISSQRRTWSRRGSILASQPNCAGPSA